MEQAKKQGEKVVSTNLSQSNLSEVEGKERKESIRMTESEMIDFIEKIVVEE